MEVYALSNEGADKPNVNEGLISGISELADRFANVNFGRFLRAKVVWEKFARYKGLKYVLNLNGTGTPVSRQT